LITLPLVKLWKLRSLICHYSWINIKIRYKGTYLGLLWIALEPALIFVILFTVFSSVLGGSKENFAIYFLTGIIFHNIFSRGVGGGLVSLITNQGILQASNIKREFFPVSSTVTAFIILLVEMGVFFGLMPFFEFIPTWTIALFPIILFLLIVLTLGLSYLLSILFVYVRDIQSIWMVLVLALFFVSPIFWYVDDANEILLAIHSVNPLGQLIELAHKVVVFGEIPALIDWMYASGLVAIVFIIGYGIFQKYEKYALEEM